MWGKEEVVLSVFAESKLGKLSLYNIRVVTALHDFNCMINNKKRALLTLPWLVAALEDNSLILCTIHYTVQCTYHSEQILRVVTVLGVTRHMHRS